MGQNLGNAPTEDRQLQAFMRALLDDVHALESMLEDGRLFETGHRRIGAEQEMFLVDGNGRVVPAALAVLDQADDPRLTTELALFNLEANLSPQDYGGRCLSRMEAELRELVTKADDAARRHDARVLLAGILPTLEQRDLGLENMTPKGRYHELNRATTEMAGGSFRVVIKGLDELEVTHDNVMLEACNTSFQVHFQVDPDEFVPLYNVAQAITGPVLAAAVNSPLLLGRRLWRETRVALFQRSLDARTSAERKRSVQPRVSFGRGYVRESVVEIFKEDISRFRVLLGAELGPDPMSVLAAGGVPDLQALRLHNGTIYRWNRACYGHDGKIAHLRIENRVLPAGPTVLDEMANAAFFFGLMSGVTEEYGRIEEKLPFDDAKDNFMAAAQHGMKATMTWMGRELSARHLILEQLLPLAGEGLSHAGIDADDIDRYLGVIEARVTSGQTGAEWAMRSIAAMDPHTSPDTISRALVAATLVNQQGTGPVHTWEPASVEPLRHARESYQTVGQIMTSNLFTVQPGDLVNLAASVMDWEHIRHVPVEDGEGRLVGLVSHRRLLRLLGRGNRSDEPVAVRDIMKPDPVTVLPSTTTREAIALMREHKVGCLPIVDEDARLVGIVTERDLINVAAKLLDRFLAGEEGS